MRRLVLKDLNLKNLSLVESVVIGSFIFYISIKKGFEISLILFSKGKKTPSLLINNELKIENLIKQLKPSNLLDNLFEFYLNNVSRSWYALQAAGNNFKKVKLFRGSFKKRDIRYNWKLFLYLLSNFLKLTSIFGYIFKNFLFIFKIFDICLSVLNMGHPTTVFQLFYKYYLLICAFWGLVIGLVIGLLSKFRCIINFYYSFLFFLGFLFLRLMGESDPISIILKM